MRKLPKLQQLFSVGGVGSNLIGIFKSNVLLDSGIFVSSIVARRSNFKKLHSHLRFVKGDSPSNNLAVVHAIVIPSVTVLNAREDRKGVDVLPILLVKA